MEECYFKWCENHCKDEPICKLPECTASKFNIREYALQRVREKEQKAWESKYNDYTGVE